MKKLRVIHYYYKLTILGTTTCDGCLNWDNIIGCLLRKGKGSNCAIEKFCTPACKFKLQCLEHGPEFSCVEKIDV